MQIQDLSYKLKNDHIDLKDYQVSVEVFSLENVYTIEPGSLLRKDNYYYSNSLLWGNDVKTQGSVELHIDNHDGYDELQVDASLTQNIRSIKIRFDNLPLGTYISSVDEDKEVTEKGLLFRYPEGWRSLSTPFSFCHQLS